MDHRARGLFERGVDEQLLARVQRHRSAVPAAGEQVQPGEAAGEGAEGPVENLEERAVLDQAAFIEHGQDPALGHRVEIVMGDQLIGTVHQYSPTYYLNARGSLV